VGKKVNGTLVQGFLYQDQLKIAAELNGNGNVVSQFVYGGKSNVPEYMIKGGVVYRLVTDSLGSVRLVVDSSTGQVIQQIDYDEWGNVQGDTNPGFQPFGYAGGIYDRDTKLVRLGARDYDAFSGRWTAKDPLRFNGGDPSLYSYVRGDPISNVDPLGLAPGDRYPSQYSAARQATDGVIVQSILQNQEYGGMIYRNSDGTYSYTQPRSGGTAAVDPGGPNSCPANTTATAYYHTHGAYDPAYDNENFSPADIRYANHYHIDGYVGTPNSDFKYYNHLNGTVQSYGSIGRIP
jgi:RHS repeat-associated protein